MTTVTCQRNRIVSFTGIILIRRYILLRSEFFSRRIRDEARRRTASEKDQASIRRGRSPTDERNGQRQHRIRDDGRAKARYWFSVIFSGLRHLTAFRHYQEPISYVTLVYPGTRRPRQSVARTPARICLSERTPGGCCLDITEQRKCHTARKLAPTRKTLEAFLLK